MGQALEHNTRVACKDIFRIHMLSISGGEHFYNHKVQNIDNELSNLML
jgi:hypothetical protein